MSRTLITRRTLMQSAAGAVAASFADSLSAMSADVGPEYGNALREFGYSQIKFSGPHMEQLSHTNCVLAALNVDSLMRPYRLLAGLSAPGVDLDGWYGPRGLIPGGTFGIWLSSLSRFAAISGDPDATKIVRKWVDAFAATIEPSGKFYRDQGLRTWTFDKLVLGLVDACRFAGQRQAIDVLARVTDAALPHMPNRAVDWHEQRLGRSYTFSENQFIAWQLTGESRYLGLATRYLPESFFEPLAAGSNNLAGRHAYSHMLALSSAAKAYLVLGDEKYLRTAMNGFAFVEKQSYATGLWGPLELFLPFEIDAFVKDRLDIKVSKVETLADSIEHLRYHSETPCNAYAHFKLARYLLRITRDPQYGDSMERVMYNSVLGAKPLTKYGKAFYQSSYDANARKSYFDGYGGILQDSWPCCSGTLGQVAADYGISSYFHDGDDVYVNLYIPSTLQWKSGDAKLTLSQSGQYPLGEIVQLEVQGSRPLTFAIHLRIPLWTKNPAVSINGKRVGEVVRAGTFASLRREWRSGDKIELTLPRDLGLRAIDAHHPALVALVSGPMVLFAIGECEIPPLTRQELLSAKQQSGSGSEWLADTRQGCIRFKPWWKIENEAYTTYLKIANQT